MAGGLFLRLYETWPTRVDRLRFHFRKCEGAPSFFSFRLFWISGVLEISLRSLTIPNAPTNTLTRGLSLQDENGFFKLVDGAQHLPYQLSRRIAVATVKSVPESAAITRTPASRSWLNHVADGQMKLASVFAEHTQNASDRSVIVCHRAGDFLNLCRCRRALHVRAGNGHTANAQSFALDFAPVPKQGFNLCDHVQQLHV